MTNIPHLTGHRLASYHGCDRPALQYEQDTERPAMHIGINYRESKNAQSWAMSSSEFIPRNVPEPIGAGIEAPSREKQQEREKSEQRISYFQPVASDDRQVLGAFLWRPREPCYRRRFSSSQLSHLGS
jgi:hypothetical protein